MRSNALEKAKRCLPALNLEQCVKLSKLAHTRLLLIAYKFARFIRSTKIDELPQIWNILKNEMSLVGPRPCLPAQQDLVMARSRLGVLDDVGGITGWSQIQNVDMSDPQKLAKLDANYLALRTIPLDLKIIFLTAFGLGQGDKVKEP